MKDRHNIGFELECVGPEKAPTFSAIRKHMRDIIGEEWIDSLRFDRDTSIRMLTKHDDMGRATCEIVTPPTPRKEAMRQLEALLVWMQGYCITDHTCGLHVNISFTNPQLTSRVSYLHLVRLLPQTKILKIFDRDGNKYCSAINTKKRVHGSWSTEKIKRAIVQRFASKNKALTYDKVLSIINGPDSVLADILRQGLLESVDEALFKQLQYKDKDIFVVDRNPFSKTKRYFEFRGIGNDDYQFRVDEIVETIQVFIDTLEQSVVK